MQIVLHLFPESPIRLDFSYYPKLASAIYQVISVSDTDFAADLHHGELFQNRIKLFGFSPLHSRQTEIHYKNKAQNKSGGLVFKGLCTFNICSPWPELMNRLGEGFSKTSMMRIGSQLIQIRKAIQLKVPNFTDKMVWHLRRPASCVTSWSCKGENKKRYALPGEPINGQSCEALLRQNLIHKWRRLNEIRPDIAKAWQQNGTMVESMDFSEKDIAIRLLPLSNRKNIHQKRHQIKKASVFSWIAPIEITAPQAIQRIVWSCGLGEMNSMGFGLAEEAVQ